MTREQIAEKVAWIIAGMAAEYHGRTIEPGQVFPSDTLVMHGIDDHLALIEFSYLAEKALGIAVSDELLDDNDATVATLVDRIAGDLREHEIRSSRAAEARWRLIAQAQPSTQLFRAGLGATALEASARRRVSSSSIAQSPILDYSTRSLN